jgi:6-pyruvoyltetrahydropterin/6-carboxytetrahydropterin synthase
MRHESKCSNLHGHRYTAEITCGADKLDEVDRVIDFGSIKQYVGGWLDERWDHGTILNSNDEELIALCEKNGWRHYVMTTRGEEPTAEAMAKELFGIAGVILRPAGVQVVKVRLYETPNGWADYQ